MTKPINRIILAALVLAPAIAAADDGAASAYKRGQTALRAGRIHEACDAFEESARLDPTMETELSLADCLEQDGKIMAASRLYQSLATKDTDAGRAKRSSAKAAKLEAKAPRLRFAINPKPDGLVIKVDGQPIQSESEVRVDIGPHEVLAMAPGLEGHASPAVDGSHPIVDVILRMEANEQTAPHPEPTSPPAMETPAPEPKAAPMHAEMKAEHASPASIDRDQAPRASGGHRKRNGVILTAAGGTLAIGAGIMLGMAASKFNTESDLCPDHMCKNTMDLARANALLDNGTALRGAGIGAGIGGVALLAVGSYLLLTPSHESSTRVSLQVDHGSTGIAFSGSF